VNVKVLEQYNAVVVHITTAIQLSFHDKNIIKFKMFISNEWLM